VGSGLTRCAWRHGNINGLVAEHELGARVCECSSCVKLAIGSDLQYHVRVQGLMSKNPGDPEQGLEVLGRVSILFALYAPFVLCALVALYCP
jgi:hypothetical protein